MYTGPQCQKLCQDIHWMVEGRLHGPLHDWMTDWMTEGVAQWASSSPRPVPSLSQLATSSLSLFSEPALLWTLFPKFFSDAMFLEVARVWGNPSALGHTWCSRYNAFGTHAVLSTLAVQAALGTAVTGCSYSHFQLHCPPAQTRQEIEDSMQPKSSFTFPLWKPQPRACSPVHWFFSTSPSQKLRGYGVVRFRQQQPLRTLPGSSGHISAIAFARWKFQLRVSYWLAEWWSWWGKVLHLAFVR